MKTFKQYLEEKTFGLDKDVQIVYNKLFKELMNGIISNNPTYLTQRVVKFPSTELVSPSSIKATMINPVMIVGGLDYNKYSNYYSPNAGVIHLSVHSGAAKILREAPGKSIEEVAKTLPTHQQKNFINEFSPYRIKSVIQHELSHWIDDTLHGSHIKKMLDKSSNAKSRKQAFEIQKRGAPSSTTADYEVNAQIHAIKQLRKANYKIWDKLSLMDLIELYAPLNVIYRGLNKNERDYWIKKLLHRMNRENLLGKNMKHTL